MAHPVLWFEVLGEDGDALQAFYRQLFGWRIAADDPGKYGLVETGAGRGIPGGVGQVFDGTRSGVTFYVESQDVTATLAQAEQLGGKVVMPRKELPDTVIATFADPEGHIIGLVEAKPAQA
jgi:predicted enzyme related to lactoylglutathione lyase